MKRGCCGRWFVFGLLVIALLGDGGGISEARADGSLAASATCISEIDSCESVDDGILPRDDDDDDDDDSKKDAAPPFSMKEFLQTAVFGQPPNQQEDSGSSFLSMLEPDNNNNDHNDNDEENKNATDPETTIESNPFLAFFRGLVQDDDKKPTNNNDNAGDGVDVALAEILEKIDWWTHHQHDDYSRIDVVEFIRRMTDAMKKVALQFQTAFGELLLADNLDGSFPLAIPYYAFAEDSRKSPSWKRKMHRFYRRVTKAELIELHDALYLSQLSYVETKAQFEEGLRSFRSDSWRLLFGTTTGLPQLPASFLLIHKELEPLPVNTNTYTKTNPLLESLRSLVGNLNKKESKVLVTIVVRGTKELADVLSDGLLEPEEYRGGYAHAGILASGKNLANYYLPKLKELHETAQRDKVRVVLIGHSLGAGTAAIAAMELREHEFLEVEAVGFGCPSLLSQELSESTKEYITTVVNDADIVPRMSGASMANILLDLMEYDWTNDVLEDLEFSLQRAKEVFPEVSGFLPDTQKLLEWLNQQLPIRPRKFNNSGESNKRWRSVLIPPGKCIHLFRDGYGVTGTYTPSGFFSSVDFSLTLLDDHMVTTGYNRAMLAAAQDIDRDYSFQFANDVNGIVGV